MTHLGDFDKREEDAQLRVAAAAGAHSGIALVTCTHVYSFIVGYARHPPIALPDRWQPSPIDRSIRAQSRGGGECLQCAVTAHWLRSRSELAEGSGRKCSQAMKSRDCAGQAAESDERIAAEYNLASSLVQQGKAVEAEPML